MINALIIDEKDNVAVAIENIKKGDQISYKTINGEEQIVAKEDIQIYHKFSIKFIENGKPVIKYGEHIGLANGDIEIGKHVHVHNVESHREDL